MKNDDESWLLLNRPAKAGSWMNLGFEVEARLAADVKSNQRICMPVLRPLAWATGYTSKSGQTCCRGELLTTSLCR
ncbi:hypothetical protein D918_03707 [Trichuris suis]|nr:hypothetical protein D918_03707 [Trichuris suis]